MSDIRTKIAIGATILGLGGLGGFALGSNPANNPQTPPATIASAQPGQAGTTISYTKGTAKTRPATTRTSGGAVTTTHSKARRTQPRRFEIERD